MPTIVLHTHHVANSPRVGGHFWVYFQYALGLKRAGCDVYWLDWFSRSGGRPSAPVADPEGDAAALALFLRRMSHLGFSRKVIVLMAAHESAPMGAYSFVGGLSETEADAVFRRADLLLDFHYASDPELLGRFRRTALVDIDPGLLQHWMHHGQLQVADHDVWFTTGETVGVSGSRIPDCGRAWHHIRPCVSLEHWPMVFDGARAPMTTVSTWDGGVWLRDGDGRLLDNNKRVTFLDYRELPEQVDQQLELALSYGPEDAAELDGLRGAGWRIRHSSEVAGSPGAYRSYVQRSRAEFSCAKPSCMLFQNAWVSDRTICYLASGKPAVVQDTGPSRYLPNGEGLFRFSTPDDAAIAIETMNSDYERHCRAARALAEEHFDARKVTTRILEVALG